MKNLSVILYVSLFFICSTQISAQIYDDYVGAGHNQGVQITTSGNSNTGSVTASGQGLIPDQAAAARFLHQAAFGGNYSEIQNLSEKGYALWLEEQFNAPRAIYLDLLVDWSKEKFIDFAAYYGGDPAGQDAFYEVRSSDFREVWTSHYMQGEDQLRQRIAYCLSQIFVISDKSTLGSFGLGMADYYDVLNEHAFGNFRDLLFDVSMHPAMGFYLSHLSNPKSDPENNIHPDENYAREVMQLFSIGLYELNQDGSRVLDADGNFIATYGNEEVREFAKIFTGLAFSARSPDCELLELCNFYPEEWSCQQICGDEPFEVYFDSGIWGGDLTQPMMMFEGQHEPGPKTLLNGVTVPAGQTGMQDINAAIDNLFNHPNVGPFMGKRLIQFLVTSNPSPDYVYRVAQAFNDNGQGVRGDMKAVITAILLDPEARECEAISVVEHGKLKEPIMRYLNWLRAFDAKNEVDHYMVDQYFAQENLNQGIMGAPSVFSFYSPNYTPIGPISDMELVGPEFQLHNTATAVQYINAVEACVMWDIGYWITPAAYLFGDEETYDAWWDANEDDYQIRMDWEPFLALYDDPAAVVDRLDLMFTNGMMSETTRNIVLQAIIDIDSEWGYWEELDDESKQWILRFAAYLVLISPDYNILK